MTTANISPLAELRQMNVDKQREAHDTANSNMTSHTESHIGSHIYDNTVDQKTYKPARKKASNMVSRPDANTGSKKVDVAIISDSGSVRERILIEAKQLSPANVVLKTVTIKMDPALDEKIEDHCHALGKKKQDVIRDAVLLYFETLEAIE